MFDNLPPNERRRILLTSRIRFTPEVEVPRQRAIEKMIETALFVAPKDRWNTATEIMDSFEQLAGVETLQVQAVTDGLSRLEQQGRVETRRSAPQFTYRLLQSATESLQHDFNEGSLRLNRVLVQLYGGIIGDRDPQSLAPFFLELICEFFCHLGSQWADYLRDGYSRLPNIFETIEKMVDKKIEKFEINEPFRAGVARRTLYFFQQADPDFDYLKFSLGQCFYVARLLGMDGKDYLSQDIFTDKTLYLDSSVVIPALLGSSRHYQVFRSLQKVCQRLRIRLCVARPTVDEIRNVAANQEANAPSLYDQVPESLNSKVRGDFFQAYAALKRIEVDAKPEEIFKPFHDLAETIRTTLGAEIVDDDSFGSLPYSQGFDNVKEAFQLASRQYRRHTKFSNALVHDAVVFLFLSVAAEKTPDQTWMVTRDVSLPRAWSKLQPKATVIRGFLLDGLLQCISPFILEEDVKSFSELFSEAITSQVLPQSRVFDIDDFMLFQDIELDCNELKDDEVEEGLLRVKEHVLNGASYRHEDFARAAYELRRFFTSRKERYEALSAERLRLESRITTLEGSLTDHVQRHVAETSTLKEQHEMEVTNLETQLHTLKDRDAHQAAKRKRLLLLIKKVACLLVLVGIEWFVGKKAIELGEGTNKAMKVLSFSGYMVGAALAWLCLIKMLIFPKDRLRDVFPTAAEIKEVFPWS